MEGSTNKFVNGEFVDEAKPYAHLQIYDLYVQYLYAFEL